VDPELIHAAWEADVPAFLAGDTPPALDRDDLTSRGLAVCEAVSAENSHASALIEALDRGTADLHAWALAVLSDRREEMDEQAARLGFDEALTRSVLRLALMPPLSSLTKWLASLGPAERWTRSNCPNCGGPPSLAESRGLEQRRYLRCGLCAAEWLGDRLRCPFCGEIDHRQLRYRFVEGEQDRRRLAVCDSCGGRLRVMATLAPISAPGLLVAELETAYLEGLDG
jgi:FdhE protein